MPSIIEKISEAEAQASSIRKEAARQARAIEASAHQAALDRLEAAREKGRALAAASALMAEEEGKRLAREIGQEQAAESARRTEAARQALPRAAAYILERVKA